MLLPHFLCFLFLGKPIFVNLACIFKSLSLGFLFCKVSFSIFSSLSVLLSAVSNLLLSTSIYFLISVITFSTYIISTWLYHKLIIFIDYRFNFYVKIYKLNFIFIIIINVTIPLCLLLLYVISAHYHRLFSFLCHVILDCLLDILF